MLLSEIRDRTRDVLQVDSSTYSDSRIDRAVQMVFNRAILRVPRLTQASATATVAADNPEVDISGFQSFRRERFLGAEIAYSDQGTWTVSTAYTKNQLVTGDGSPDSLFYRCTADHTSSANDEPGNTGDWQSYWQQVAWKGGWQLSKVAYHTIALRLNGEPQIERVQYDSNSISFVNTARSEKIGFKDNDTAYLYPVPDSAYTLRVFYTEPLLLKNGAGAVQSWTIGGVTEGTYSPNIDDEYIDPLITHGVAPLCEQPFAGRDGGSGDILPALDQWLNELRGLVAPSAGVVEKDENCYL